VSAEAVEILARLAALTPALRSHAEEADRLARLPEPVVRELIALRAFRLWIPRRFDGLELGLAEALRIYEAAARIDGSVGWAVMIGAGGGLFAACLEPATAYEIFGPAAALIAGSGAPDGSAERVDDGYRVSGEWRYASGACDATTFTANCVVTHDGRPVRGADGAPLIRAMAFTPAQVVIRASWDSIGMRGTGSHDFAVRDAWVPERRSFSVQVPVMHDAGPLYQLPFAVLTELPVAAVAVGVAQHALDAFAMLAARKRAQGAAAVLADDALVQAAYAESHARCVQLRAALYALADRAWAAALCRRALGPEELAEITASCAAGVAQLIDAVGVLARLAGMTAIARQPELARACHDLQALAAHAAVAPQQLVAAGRALLAAPQER
jgi:alkylation response protein AidB-like acyl-CoA dehydrogenase